MLFILMLISPWWSIEEKESNSDLIFKEKHFLTKSVLVNSDGKELDIRNEYISIGQLHHQIFFLSIIAFSLYMCFLIFHIFLKYKTIFLTAITIIFLFIPIFHVVSLPNAMFSDFNNGFNDIDVDIAGYKQNPPEYRETYMGEKNLNNNTICWGPNIGFFLSIIQCVIFPLIIFSVKEQKKEGISVDAKIGRISAQI